MDWSAPIGIALGIIAIVGGRILEGGNPLFLLQHTAFFIVFGGTFGAMIYGAQKEDVLNLFKLVGMSFRKAELHPVDVIPGLVKLAEKARREGLLSLEREVANVTDPFLKQGLQLVADGTDPEIVKSILSTQLEQIEARHGRVAKMLESGAGYAPTIGIIGAVLGLVAVMEHLSEGIDKVGPGIAVAFVATIYGLVLANMLLFPMAGKLRLLSEHELLVRQVILDGILSIQAGDNPRIIEERLKSFLSTEGRVQYDEIKVKVGKK